MHKEKWHGGISADFDVAVVKKLLRFCWRNKITIKSLEKFEKRYIENETNYDCIQFRKAIRNFLRFCRARGHDCLDPWILTDKGINLERAQKNDIMLSMKTGPGKPPKVDLIKKARKLRAKKLSYREIGERLDRHHSQVYAWINNPEYKWVR